MVAPACFSRAHAVRFAFALISLLIIWSDRTARAEWSVDPTVNTPIAVADNAQSTSVACTDGAGGAIIAWIDDRLATGANIYAQRIDGDGNPLWGLNGIPICLSAGIQDNPAIIADGVGGAIITWQDPLSGVGTDDIYAQRVNAAGSIMWALNGALVCAAAGSQIWPMLISDGAGGAIITWEDARNAGVGDPMEIYVQHVSAATGAPTWIVPPPPVGTGPGVAICLAPALQAMPMIVSDSAGGAIINWYDMRDFAATGTASIFARRVDAAGGLPLGWIVDGTELCGPASLPIGSGLRTWPVLCTDGLGGAIVTWDDARAGAADWNIYARRITFGGVMPAPWLPGGSPVCTFPGDQQYSRIVSDGSGGAIITWQDARIAADINIYAQHLNIFGAVVAPWPPAGAPVCLFTTDQEFPKIVTDGSGGAVISWNDARDGTSNIYAQRIDGATPARDWIPVEGIAVGTALGDQDWMVQHFATVSDGDGGAIITWNDGRRAAPLLGPDIYAQKVRYDGVLGDPETVGYWRFEEGSGSTAADSSGLGNTGTLFDNVVFTSTIPCATIESRPNASAISGGDGPYPTGPPYVYGVQVPDSPSLRPGGAITLEAWVRPRKFSPDVDWGTYGFIITKQQRIACDPYVCEFPSFVLAAGQGATWAIFRNANNSSSPVYGPELKLEQWSHVAATWDSLTQQTTLYINFVPVATANYGWKGPITYQNRPVIIGALAEGESGEYSSGFDGEIDEARISDIVRTPSTMLHAGSSCELTPNVYVYRPNGYIDTLTVGTNFNIGWLAFDDGGVQSMTLEYSFDGGQNYNLIASGEANDSLYTWLVPDTPSDSCRVRATAYDGDGNSTSALSLYFWIVAPATPIVALSPSPLVFASAVKTMTSCDTLYVRNTGTATLTINGISGCSASPFAIDTTMTAHSVAPGDTTEIVVCVTPTDYLPATCTLSIVSNAINSPAEVEVRVDQVTGVGDGDVPKPFQIVSVSPNPFNPETTVHFTLPRAMPVRAEIWDVRGARVRTLSRDQRFGPGAQRITWDGRNDDGSGVASGVYFIRLATPVGTKVARAVLLK
jgi:hypothetical protein